VLADRFRLAVAGVVFVGLNLLVVAGEPALMRVVALEMPYTVPRFADFRLGPRRDVLFLGSSLVANGFDPALAEREIHKPTGATVTAASFPMIGAFVELYYLFLKNVVTPAKAPRVIVYGIWDTELLASPVGRDYPYVELLLRPDDFPRYSGSTGREQARFLLEQALPLYRDRRLIRRAAAIVFDPYDPVHADWAAGKDTWRGGYIAIPATERAPDPEAARQSFLSVTRDFRLNPAQIERYDAFLRLARKRGIQVVLVNMPVSLGHRRSWARAEDMQAYLWAVRGLAARHGVPLVDAYEDAEGLIPARGFYDSVHLNCDGAAALTRAVSRRVLAGYFAIHG
jgi:hypothetical protein